jgi:hypothetical protein
MQMADQHHVAALLCNSRHRCWQWHFMCHWPPSAGGGPFGGNTLAAHGFAFTFGE